MDHYSRTVSFHCTFSEPAVLENAARVFVPRFVSLSPSSGESTEFVITAETEDNTIGMITLLLGEGAFRSGSELSPEYSVSASCRLRRVNLNCRQLHCSECGCEGFYR